MNDMGKIEESATLHQQATELEDEAFFARRAKDIEAEQRFTREAFVKEAKSAELLRHDPSHHMHAILHRSAATLAFRCGEYDAAEQILFHGLLAKPDQTLREELYDLLAKVRFRQSLEFKAPPLDNDDLVMTWQGPDADSGLLDDTALADQIRKWGELIRSTASLINGLKIAKWKQINKSFRVLAAPPAKGSFKISLRLVPIGPGQLPGFEMVERVNARILQNFVMLGKGRLMELQSSFADHSYYNDFMERATEVAPDGERVTALGINAGLKGSRQSVLFARTRADIESVYIPLKEESNSIDYQLSDERVTKTGVLKFADSRSDEEEIQLIEDNGDCWRIIVPAGFDERIVNEHYKRRVSVSGRFRYKTRPSNRLLLESISEVN